MRIHHIVNSFSLSAGGAERVVRSLHLGLRDRGIESFILGLEAQPDGELDWASCLELNSSYGLRALQGIRQYIKPHVREGDLIHAHLFPSNLYISMLKQLGVISEPVVATEHSTANRRREHWAGSHIDSVVYRGFDRVFAISDGTEQELLRWRPKLQGRTAVVMNGSRLLFDQPLTRKASSPVVVLSIGSLRKEKNYDTALSALALLEDIDFEYWIAGKGAERETLEQQANTLGISDRVKFLGHVDKIKGILKQADIFLMPSRREGFGLAAVEAMNASLPVVGSDVPGLRDIVDRSCAVLVDPQSPAVIADVLRGLLESNEKQKMLGMNGFARSQMFDEAKMIEAYMQQYREVLNHA